jgi:hypothetical protein
MRLLIFEVWKIAILSPSSSINISDFNLSYYMVNWNNLGRYEYVITLWIFKHLLTKLIMILKNVF